MATLNCYNDDARIHAMLENVAALLDRLVQANDTHVAECGGDASVTRFHARSVPPISVVAYLKRMLKYAPFPAECVVTILIFLDRLCSYNRRFIVTSLNVHRLLITGLTLAAKFHCDNLYTNTHYAKVGGISSRELRLLEFEMLRMLRFNLRVSNEEIQLYASHLASSATAISSPLSSPLTPSHSIQTPPETPIGFSSPASTIDEATKQCPPIKRIRTVLSGDTIRNPFISPPSETQNDVSKVQLFANFPTANQQGNVYDQHRPRDSM